MPAAGIKKYYIGLAVLMVVAIGALVYTVSQGASAKADAKTNKAVQDVSSKLENYIITSNVVPASLQAAGVTNVPSTVTYTKLSATKYKICFDYKAASNGFDAGWTSLLGGALAGQSSYTSPSNSSYFDGGVEFSHKKGENCQTITPNVGLNNYNGSLNNQFNTKPGDTGCGSYDSTDAVSGSVDIASVDTTAKQINFSASNQYVFDASGSYLPTMASKNYTANTLFCDASQKATTVAALKAGQTVTIYMKTASDTTVDRVDVY